MLIKINYLTEFFWKQIFLIIGINIVLLIIVRINYKKVSINAKNINL